jgi:rubrerythrin
MPQHASLLGMAEPNQTYPDLRDDQILTIGIYGETVAAYRYTVLSERVPGEADRKAFADIADEEQGHKRMLQNLLEKHFPGSSFYLADEDKALVLTGPRLINVRDIKDYKQVMKIALDTELRTSQFYHAMSTRAQNPELRKVFEELAVEGFEHHRRLLQLAQDRGFLPAE